MKARTFDEKDLGSGHVHRVDLMPPAGQTRSDVSWLHMCIKHAETAAYLVDVEHLDKVTADAMLQEETRSRILAQDDGVMVLLKAMRQGEGFKPEDMISLRVWIDDARVITTREADVDPILDLRDQLAQGKGPSTSAGFLADLIDAHLSEVGSTVDSLEKVLDGLDAHRLTDMKLGEMACGELAACSLTIAGLLRHLSPQRVVFERLSGLSYPFVADRHRARWGEALDTLLLLLESLQSLRERITIVTAQVQRMQDRHRARQSQLLSVVAGAFLPTTFFTGLLGMNVAGIPLADHPLAFAMVALICVVFASVTLYCIGRRRWWHS